MSGDDMAHSHPAIPSSAAADSDDFAARNSNFSAYDPTRLSCEGSPMMMSPWNQSPFAKSPCSNPVSSGAAAAPQAGLVGSLVREEGHIYSLAARDGVLYTGSDSKNIRVWKNLEELSAFKSNSGLVKAIIISGESIFTGHQDGKVRVWRAGPGEHRRVGTMPTFFDILKASMRPRIYKTKRSAIKHSDAISCLTIDEEKGLLYSASWDRTFKVWRIDNSKCVESVQAHEDAVNSVVSAGGGVVYTGSADGKVKVWRREEINGGRGKHVCAQTLLSQECAVTALAVSRDGAVVYGGSSDGLVNFWEARGKSKEGEMVAHGGVLKGHKLAVLCLAAAGGLVFSGSADNTICVWRREGAVHTCLSVLTGHNGPVKCLTVEEDRASAAAGGDRKWVVYSGSLDKSVKVWSVSETAPDVGPMRAAGMDENFNWESIPSAKY